MRMGAPNSKWMVLFDIHRAEIFEEVPVPPRIGLERHRNDRNPGALGKLDADGIEMRGVENGTARALRKNNDGTALLEPRLAALEHRDEIFTGIAAADDDGLARPEHGAEEGILQQAFLHHKGHVLPRLDHGRQHKRLQRAHMVADKDARAFQ